MIRVTTVQFSGIIFNPTQVNSAIAQATKQTLQDAKTIVRDRTPVRTGLLRSKWETNSDSLFNETFYSYFVEEGTRMFSGRFMLRDSLPQIEQKAVSNITRLLK